MNLRTTLMRSFILLLTAAFALGVSGCVSTSDASDPDPHYYKGKHFTHKKTG